MTKKGARGGDWVLVYDTIQDNQHNTSRKFTKKMVWALKKLGK